MDWFFRIVFAVTFLGALIDFVTGVRLFKDSTPLPSRNRIKWDYVSNGLFIMAISLLLITASYSVSK